jgi:hypothetical protein
VNTLINICFHKRLLISDQPAIVTFSEGLNSIDVVGIALGCYVLVGVGLQMQAGRRGIDFDLSIDIYRCVKLFD